MRHRAQTCLLGIASSHWIIARAEHAATHLAGFDLECSLPTGLLKHKVQRRVLHGRPGAARRQQYGPLSDPLRQRRRRRRPLATPPWGEGRLDDEAQAVSLGGRQDVAKGKLEAVVREAGTRIAGVSGSQGELVYGLRAVATSESLLCACEWQRLTVKDRHLMPLRGQAVGGGSTMKGVVKAALNRGPSLLVRQ